MSRPLLEFLDGFFLVFHTVLVIFNVTGWAFRKTRRLHLATMGVTAVSWLVMGAWKGVGYCVCTDWHWQVRSALGYQTRSHTYIQFLVERLFGVVPDEATTRWVSAIVFVIAALLSIVLDLRDSRRPK
jgi:hypothetical protein